MTLVTSDTIQRIRTVLGNVPGSPYFNNIYVTADPGSAQNEVDAVGAFWNRLGTEVMIDYLDGTTEGEVANVDPDTGSIVGFSTNDAVTISGGNGGEILPIATQMLIRFRTGEYVSGRELRGRLFVPALHDSVNADGVPSSAERAAVLDAVEDLNDVPALNGALVVYSPTHRVAAYVTSMSVSDQFSVLRSRRD